jgi:ribonuclease VapC
MADILLDASAMLAVIQVEPGAEVVRRALHGAAISAVNLAEVVTKLVERGLPADDALQSVRAFPIPVMEFDSSLAERTGTLRRATKEFGLSLADRACLALAEREGLPVLTTDRKWAELDIGVDIRLVR